MALTAAAAALHCDRVQLIEEEHAGRTAARLVEDFAHVGLALTKPHRQQLGALQAAE
jgi:hypothetical protein